MPGESNKPATQARPKRIRVRATKMGYYDHVLRREGDVFTISDEAHFSKKWMERVPANTPESKTGSNDALAREGAGNKLAPQGAGDTDESNPLDA